MPCFFGIKQGGIDMGWLKDGLENRAKEKNAAERKDEELKQKQKDLKLKDREIAEKYKQKHDNKIKKLLLETATQLDSKANSQISHDIFELKYQLKDNQWDPSKYTNWIRYDIRWTLLMYKGGFLKPKLRHVLMIQIGFGSLVGTGSSRPHRTTVFGPNQVEAITVKRVRYQKGFPSPIKGSSPISRGLGVGVEHGHKFDDLSIDSLKESIIKCISNSNVSGRLNSRDLEEWYLDSRHRKLGGISDMH